MILSLRTVVVILAGLLVLSAAGMICVVQSSTIASGDEEGLTVISYGMRAVPANPEDLAGQMEMLARQYYPWMLDLKISPGTVDNCKRFGTVLTLRYDSPQDLAVGDGQVPVQVIRVILPSELLCVATRYPNSDAVGSYILLSDDGVHFSRAMWLSEEKANMLLALI
ncbi:MAG: hypothetical protein O0W99_06575 [Methanocorpusculum sp.]|nr:hypothetical protein [Methanocorpusculum sp.]